MKNCKEITRLCSESMERPLSLGESAAVQLHVAMCRGCRNFRGQMQLLRSMARVFRNRPGPPADPDQPA